APAQELVALEVALVLDLDVLADRHRRAVAVDLDRVIDDEVARPHRVHGVRVAAQGGEGLAHGGEVDDRRHAGEVLEDDASRAEGDLVGRLRRRIPAGQGPDVVGADRLVVLVAEQVLEQNAQRVGEGGDLADPGAGGGVGAEDLDLGALEVDGRAATEAVLAHRPRTIACRLAAWSAPSSLIRLISRRSSPRSPPPARSPSTSSSCQRIATWRSWPSCRSGG